MRTYSGYLVAQQHILSEGYIRFLGWQVKLLLDCLRDKIVLKLNMRWSLSEEEGGDPVLFLKYLFGMWYALVAMVVYLNVVVVVDEGRMGLVQRELIGRIERFLYELRSRFDTWAVLHWGHRGIRNFFDLITRYPFLHLVRRYDLWRDSFGCASFFEKQAMKRGLVIAIWSPADFFEALRGIGVA